MKQDPSSLPESSGGSSSLEHEKLYRKDKTAIRAMFNHIAKDYDRLNRIMSLGMDRSWRSACVKSISETHPKDILDIATGTGDLALALKRANPQAKVVGLDLTEGMLEIAREKTEAQQMSQDLSFVCGDALDMDFPDARFDAVSIAFGVRNFEDISKGFSEIRRVLKEGGTLAFLELCEPQNAVVKTFYRFYSQKIIPRLGRLFAQNQDAYQYLPDSIRTVPQREAMCRLLEEAGFRSSNYHTFVPGVCALYIATK